MTYLPPVTAMRPGLADPVLDSQRLFRVILEALAEPGRVRRLPVLADAPPPLPGGAAAICLTLVDADTPVWIDPTLQTGAVGAWLSFHCGCPVVATAAEARFAVLPGGVSPATLAEFSAGEPLYPDRSATLIVDVAGIGEGQGVMLTGPGIPAERRLALHGVAEGFWPFVAMNHRRFPLGVDLLCVAGTALVGLPRSTRPDV